MAESKRCQVDTNDYTLNEPHIFLAPGPVFQKKIKVWDLFLAWGVA